MGGKPIHQGLVTAQMQHMNANQPDLEPAEGKHSSSTIACQPNPWLGLQMIELVAIQRVGRTLAAACRTRGITSGANLEYVGQPCFHVLGVSWRSTRISDSGMILSCRAQCP